MLPARPPQNSTCSVASARRRRARVTCPRRRRAHARRRVRRSAHVDADVRKAVAPGSRDISPSANGSRRGPRSSSVTRTPSGANIDANSQPITPPPITISDSGMRSTSRISSLSWTSGSSNGMPGGPERRRAGGDQEHRRRRQPVRRRRAASTRRVCGIDEAGAAAERASRRGGPGCRARARSRRRRSAPGGT